MIADMASEKMTRFMVDLSFFLWVERPGWESVRSTIPTRAAGGSVDIEDGSLPGDGLELPPFVNKPSSCPGCFFHGGSLELRFVDVLTWRGNWAEIVVKVLKPDHQDGE